MIGAFKSAAEDTARRVALGFLSILALCVGVLFLTLAAWIVISQMADPTTAALVIGITYVGVGLILGAFAAARRSGSSRRREDFMAPPAPIRREKVYTSMAAAFFEGLGAGLATRGRNDRSGTRYDPDDYPRR